MSAKQNSSNVDRDLRQAHDAFSRSDFSAAFATADRVLRDQPALTEARLIRANAALKLQRWLDAVGDLEWLRARAPGQPKLSRSLARCLLHVGDARRETNDLNGAIKAYLRASAVDTASDVALLKLARAYLANGDDDEAARKLNLISERSTDLKHLHTCCRLLAEAGSLDAAKTLAYRLVAEDGGNIGWVLDFCRHLRECGDLDGSRAVLSRVLQQNDDPIARLRIDLALALGLPSTYQDRESLSAVRADFSRRLDQFVASYPRERIATMSPPPSALAWDNFYLAYQGENDRDLQSRFGDWYSDSLTAMAPKLTARARSPRLRLAVVSSRLHECTVGSYFASWIEYLAGCGWQVTLAHIGDRRDQVTERMARVAHRELNLEADTFANASRLSELDADLLLYPELGMDHRVLSLAALRLAPRQVCAWGHPVTSGLPTIDAFLSCAAMEPEDASTHYRERLLTLPGLGTRYLSPQIPAAQSRAALGLPARGTLYLVPQSLYKLHPDNDDVFADLLRGDADAILVFFAGILPGALRSFRARLRARLDQAGIALEKRCVFLPLRSRTDYLCINLACDVMLDSLHWSGGNTTLDALHCGLPVVTTPGRFMRGRQSMAMLRGLGCEELVAGSPQQLSGLAASVAHDRARRREIQQRIQANLAAFVGSEEPLRVLDAILRKEIGAD